MIKSVAFYPEYIAEEKWEENFRKLRDGGIESIRFGEFAWGLIEPQEGVYNWDVFDKAFDMAAEYGIKIILGTPTATPPLWLCDRYPEALPVNERSEIVDFGARQHRCYNSPEMNEQSDKIVTALAKRYGKRENLLAWQIDNELAAEHKFCFCEHCTKLFQEFLREKYQTIEALNKRWLTTFWAQNYSDFSEIPTPYVIEPYLPTRHHPSLQYEFSHFSSESTTAFCDRQYDIIKKYSDAPVTTNQDDFSLADNTDWYRIFEKLDFVGFDIYTTRLYEMAFYYDFARSLKNKPFWLMEYGSGFPCLPEVLDDAYEFGCGGIGLFKFNPFPAGQEMGTKEMVDQLGKERKNYYIYRDWKPKAFTPRKKLLLHYDFFSSWAYFVADYRSWETGFEQRQSRLTYQRYLIHTVYKTVYESGASVDVVKSLGDGKGQTLLMPMKIVYNEAFEQELLHFIKTGGTVVTTSDLFLKNGDNAFMEVLPKIYAELLGENASFVDEISVPLELAYGEGKITFLPMKSSEETWKSYM